METIYTVKKMQAWSRDVQVNGKRLAFVPTMGALHEGHISLINEAHTHADKVVVSIFVNPLQFDNAEDLKQYPRGAEDDLLICKAEKVDAVFMPSVEEMYPDLFQTNVQVAEVTQSLCGAARPGHFDGVATVVLKLLNMAQADCAIFGEKDYQQLAMIRQMVRDLNLPIQIIGHPIVREPDGLAMSSRNRRLSSEAREQALVLHRSIQKVQKRFTSGDREVASLLEVAQACFDKVPAAKIDYLEIRDAVSLAEIDVVKSSGLYAVAAFVGAEPHRVRLIDNCVLR